MGEPVVRVQLNVTRMEPQPMAELLFLLRRAVRRQLALHYRGCRFLPNAA